MLASDATQKLVQNATKLALPMLHVVPLLAAKASKLGLAFATSTSGNVVPPKSVLHGHAKTTNAAEQAPLVVQKLVTSALQNAAKLATSVVTGSKLSSPGKSNHSAS